MELYLDPKETELLIRLLDRSLEEIQREINHTDHAAFKAGLKVDQTLMHGILAKLKAPAAMGI
ncbi:hypothetical protein [Geothrix edaphica]|uniref:Uncharacterized protein n=1 Tax=Geothrix edaphica TaxID=2927976 RepID=A0ABQ5Q0G5_9BACT|nr:hypothetical protein [Geothrix edaphica]GLH67896.1 hypothetical protein GETHED_22600 [Geothrix edaphica]